jgi:hypothetical protein
MKLFLILFVIALCILPICASASLPLVGFPIKPSPATGPYDDEKFLEQTNTTIYGLSNQTIPTGLALRNLQTQQQQLSKMSISPELYPEAELINTFLYYTGKAGDEYDDANIISDKPYTPITSDSAIFREAEEYYQAAQTIWEKIKGRYPGVTLYTMKSSSSSDSNSDSDLFNYETQTQQRGHSGLW